MLSNILFRYLSPNSPQPRHLAPSVPLRQLVTPWEGNFSSSSSSIFTASICCGSTLQPSTLSLSASAPSSSSSTTTASKSPSPLSADHVTSYNSLRIGRQTAAAATPSLAVVSHHVVDASTTSYYSPSSLFPTSSCLTLPKSSSAPPSTAPFAAARFSVESTFCTSAACTSSASLAHLDARLPSSSRSSPSVRLFAPESYLSNFDGHTIMGCEGNGFGGCSIAVRFSRAFELHA